MNQCATITHRPGHERPYRCRWPAGHGMPHTYTDPPVAEQVGDRLAWDIAERPETD